MAALDVPERLVAWPAPPASAGSHAGAAPELAHGLLELDFARDSAGTTMLRRRRHRFPLRMTAPLRLDPRRPDMAFVYAQNPTGAVFAGDRLRVVVRVAEGGCLHMTTPSATKVHRMDAGEATQDTVLELGPGAYVESIPDMVIPQRGSRYRQSTEAILAPGARLVLSEALAPGREARGERFAFERLQMETHIRDASGDLVVDRLELVPEAWDPMRRGITGDRPFVGTIHAVAPGEDSEALVERLGAALGRHPGVLAAAGTLPNDAGAFARILAADAPSLRSSLRSGWSAAREALLGIPAPEIRK